MMAETLKSEIESDLATLLGRPVEDMGMTLTCPGVRVIGNTITCDDPARWCAWLDLYLDRARRQRPCDPCNALGVLFAMTRPQIKTALQNASGALRLIDGHAEIEPSRLLAYMRGGFESDEPLSARVQAIQAAA
jgi:hypothetical protein